MKANPPHKKRLTSLIRELLIVVTGILIAFSLNSWAETIKEKKTSQTYLNALEEDLEKDLTTLQQYRDSLVQLQRLAQRLSAYVFEPSAPGRDQAVLQAFSKLSQAPYFSPNQSTFQTLINSGDLKFIKDLRFRNQIVDHYKRYESLENENYRIKTFIESTVVPYFMEHADFKKLFRGEGAEHWSDPRFTNILFSYQGIYQLPIKKYEETIQRSKALLKRIQS